MKRLRAKYSDDELATIYATPHIHTGWQDHRARVRSTIALAQFFEGLQSVADLSAGDCAIINALDVPKKYIGDFAPGYEFTGALEDTLDLIPAVDLFICSETIEHLDDPAQALAKIRSKTKHLVLSTPIDESNDANPQHYWGWSAFDMEQLLIGAGFKPQIYSSLEFTNPSLTYNYQIWGCS